MKEPTYHFTTDRVTGNHVLFSRHALPPHDVVNRIEFQSTATIREVAESMIDLADAIDTVSEIDFGEIDRDK